FTKTSFFLLRREKRKRPLSSERHKTNWRSGIFSAAQPEWLMTRGAGRWSLDTKKSASVNFKKQKNEAIRFAFHNIFYISKFREAKTICKEETKCRSSPVWR